MDVTLALADENPEIGSDIPCVACGYNLRGLHPDGLCPECGGSIQTSLTEHVLGELDRLHSLEADPRWCRRVAEGLMILLMAAGFSIIAAAVTDTGRVPDLLLAFIATQVIVGWGLWKLTSAEPRRQAGTALNVSRRCVRAGAIVWLGAAPLMIVLEGQDGLQVVVVLAGAVAGLLATAASFPILHQLIRRTELQQIAEAIPALAVAQSAGFVVSLLNLAISLPIQFHNPQPLIGDVTLLLGLPRLLQSPLRFLSVQGFAAGVLAPFVMLCTLALLGWLCVTLFAALRKHGEPVFSLRIHPI